MIDWECMLSSKWLSMREVESTYAYVMCRCLFWVVWMGSNWWKCFALFCSGVIMLLGLFRFCMQFKCIVCPLTCLLDCINMLLHSGINQPDSSSNHFSSNLFSLEWCVLIHVVIFFFFLHIYICWVVLLLFVCWCGVLIVVVVILNECNLKWWIVWSLNWMLNWERERTINENVKKKRWSTNLSF